MAKYLQICGIVPPALIVFCCPGPWVQVEYEIQLQSSPECSRPLGGGAVAAGVEEPHEKPDFGQLLASHNKSITRRPGWLQPGSAAPLPSSADLFSLIGLVGCTGIRSSDFRGGCESHMIQPFGSLLSPNPASSAECPCCNRKLYETRQAQICTKLPDQAHVSNACLASSQYSDFK